MKQIESLNIELDKIGLPALAIVNPSDCKSREKNARYMDQQVFNQLVANIKRDGRLESTPLVRDMGNGTYETISGHHRIKASIAAELPKILCLVITEENESTIIAKQLSHNALVGEDDITTLKNLYDSIDDIENKMYSALQSEIDKVSYVSFNFRAGVFEELLFVTFPEDIVEYDHLIEDIEQSQIKPGSKVRLIEKQAHQDFLNMLMEIKKVEDIKSNSAAFSLILSLAREKWDETCETK